MLGRIRRFTMRQLLGDIHTKEVAVVNTLFTLDGKQRPLIASHKRKKKVQINYLPQE